VAEQSERDKQLNCGSEQSVTKAITQQQQAEQGEKLKAHLATEAQKLVRGDTRVFLIL
jgi:hypothetical protein